MNTMSYKNTNKTVKFSGWSVVLGCFLLLFFGSALFAGTAGLFMSPICEEYGFSTSKYSSLTIFTSAATFLTTTFLVPKIHTGNMKRIMFIALFFMASGFALYSVSFKFWHFIVCGLIMNAGLSFFMHVPVGMMITNWFVSKRSMAMSIAMSANGLGGVVWTSVMAKLIASYGWKSAYRIGTLIGLVGLTFVIIFLLKRSPEEYGQTPLIDTGASEETVDSTQIKQFGMTMQEARKTLAFYLHLLRQFISGILSAGVTLHIVTFLVTEAWSYLEAASVVTVYKAFSIVGALIVGAIINKIGLKKSVLTVGSLLTFGIVLLSTAGTNRIFAYTYAVLGGLCNCVLTLTPPLLIPEVFGSKDYTQIYSFSNAVFLVGCGLGATVIAVLSNTFSYQIAFLIVAVLCALLVAFDVGSLTLAKKYRKFFE